MAKARDLAALAGLAGLAYAYNKNKGDKGDKRTDARSPGDEMSVYAANRGMSDDDKVADDGYKKDVLKALEAPKTAPNDKAPNQGIVPPKSSGKSAAAKLLGFANHQTLANWMKRLGMSSDPTLR